MTIDIYYTLIALIISCIGGLLTTPAILDFCKRKGLYDLPNARKVHKTQVPRMGGVVFLPCVIVGCIVVFAIYRLSGEDKLTLSLWTVYFFFGALLIYATGLIDDILGLKARTKLLVQVLAAIALPLSGLYINNLQGLFGIYEIPFYVGAPLTIFLVTFVSNSMNLIDGIDGLSGSLSVMALVGFLYYFTTWGVPFYSIIIASLIGVLLAFLWFNIWGNASKNRKIFMGDTGSLTLGFLLSFLCLKLSMVNPNLKLFDGNGLLISMTLLFIPTFDAARVALMRIIHGRSPMSPDKTHIHHKMLNLGLSQHQALVAVTVLAALYIALNYFLSLVSNVNVIVVADVLLYALLHLLINFFIKQRSSAS